MIKRGVSVVVATVLIILITIVAVTVLWMFVIPMVSNSLDFRNVDVDLTITTEGYTVYDSSRGIAMVQVRRGADEVSMNRIKVSFLINGNSFSSNLVAPNISQSKKYSFDLSGYGEPSEVSVSPIFISSRGKEKEGNVVSKVLIPKSSISEVDGVVYGVGVDSFMEISTDELISIWTFSGDVKDGWGNSDGVLKGDANVDNGYLNLDGNNDYVDLGILNDYDFLNNQSFSFSAWVKPEGFNYTDYNTIIGLNWDAVQNISPPFLRFHEGKINFGVWYWSVNNEVISSRNWTSSDFGRWSHLAGVFNGTHYFIYINGTLDNFTAAAGPVMPSYKPIALGGQLYHGPQRFFNGLIDDVMIFNRSLSSKEVVGIYEAQYRQ